MVGANHRSRFHSEVRASHTISQPMTANTPTTTTSQQTSLHRKNSKPVRVTTHPWPAIDNFDHSPQWNFDGQNQRANFNLADNFSAFRSNQPLQRLFKPTNNPYPVMNNSSGLQQFFHSIDEFRPHTHTAGPLLKHTEADPNKMFSLKPHRQSVSAPHIESPSGDESESSSIRSSASAYWPPELKFNSNSQEEENKSWRFRKPLIQLRRISPPASSQRYH